MSKNVIIRLSSAGNRISKFSIYDNIGNLLASDVSAHTLAQGYVITVNDNVTVIKILPSGKSCCSENILSIPIELMIRKDYINLPTFVYKNTGSVWKHLLNPTTYNKYYGCIYPYIIEYPFAYKYQDEILQSVEDYSKVYKYFPDENGIFDDSRKIEIDNEFFNKAVLYNGQQSTGYLYLSAKPVNNLKSYLQYPIINSDSKTILYTKKDNFYRYNTFWSVVKNKTIPLFKATCETMSLDKVVNQDNMDYSTKSFKKEPLRAKDLKIRHILDNKSDIHIVSQFLTHDSQISYL